MRRALPCLALLLAATAQAADVTLTEVGVAKVYRKKIVLNLQECLSSLREGVATRPAGVRTNYFICTSLEASSSPRPRFEELVGVEPQPQRSHGACAATYKVVSIGYHVTLQAGVARDLTRDEAVACLQNTSAFFADPARGMTIHVLRVD